LDCAQPWPLLHRNRRARRRAFHHRATRPSSDARARGGAPLNRILIIEDNSDLAFGLRNNLEIEGYQVATAADGTGGLEALRQTKPDLLILDLMLPGLDGFRLLKALRQEAPLMPVLILAAKAEEADKVRGFRLGADDYVTKPFGLLELLARVERLLRRSPGMREAEIAVLRFGALEVDASARAVRRDGRLV